MVRQAHHDKRNNANIGGGGRGMGIVKQKQYDVIVVGAGSGGYAAARTARERGAAVALVDHGPLGGLCILRGCMPSKTLIATSDRLHDIRSAGELGVRVGEPSLA